MGLVVRKISRGIVAVNKERNSKVISAWPIDLLPELDDDLTDASEIVEIKAIDDFGKTVFYKARRSAVIKNIVWGGDTNRLTAPDVRRGERVNIYQVGDDDRYYWSSCGMDDNLRRLETVIRTVNANPDNNKENDETNTWREEWNAHDGHITLQTTMANGEVAAFTIQTNGKTGVYVVEDEKGNMIYLDSVNTDIAMVNADGTMVQLIKDTINMKCVNWNVDAENITINSKKTTWNSSDNWNLSTKSFNVSAGSSATIQGGAVTINGTPIKLN